MRADFYRIADPEPWQFTCRLVEKAFNQKHQVYLHTAHAGDAEKLNTLLWTFRQQSFIPHGLLGQFTTLTPPIEIGFGPYATQPKHHHDILINLTHELPPFADQFNRVIEITTNQPEIQAHHDKYAKYYQEAGFTLYHHDLVSR